MAQHVETTARERLLEPEKHQGLVSRTEYQREFLLWRFPSFKPYSSWALYREAPRNRAELFYVRRLQWDAAFELPTSRGEPDIFGAEARLEPKVAIDLLASMRAVRFEPLHNVGVTGIDGTTFGVAVGSFQTSTRLQWWSVIPPEWKPLQEWHDHAVSIFERAMPESAVERRRTER